MNTHRTMLFAGLSTLMLGLTAPLPLLADGDNKPIVRTGILAKDNSGSQPIKPGSLSDQQLEKAKALGQTCCEEIFATALIEDLAAIAPDHDGVPVE